MLAVEIKAFDVLPILLLAGAKRKKEIKRALGEWEKGDRAKEYVQKMNMPQYSERQGFKEQYTELKSKGILLWMYDDKLIYALATFLESEKMTIDEIREFLLNNPETWT